MAVVNKYKLIYFVGDSYTEGHHTDNVLAQPIPIHQRFTSIVASKLKTQYKIDAKGGGSNTWIHRQLYRNIPKLYDETNGKLLVVVSWSEPTRIEMFSGQRNSLETINDSNFDVEFVKMYFNEAYCDDHRLYDDLTKTLIESCRSLLTLLNIDYIETFSNGPVLDVDFLSSNKTLIPSYREICGTEGSIYNPELDFYGHQNVIGNQCIANSILEKISELYYNE